MASAKLVKVLIDGISSIACVNSHSHILPESVRLTRVVDALTFFNDIYPRADLLAAGMANDDLERVTNADLSLLERWRIFEPYWQSVRLTGYSQCITESFRGLYGFSELTRETVGAISAAIRASSKPGYYSEILRNRCNIRISVLNVENLIEVDSSLFVQLPRLNRFSSMREGYLSAEQIRSIEKDYDASIGSLDDHLDVIWAVCEQWRRAKVAGIKLSHSNHRRLDFRERRRVDAATAFDRLLQKVPLAREEARLLEDFLVFECCRAASEFGLTIQFHTGMRAANNRSLEGASPAPLVPLMKAFPNARFDLSHSGYPYLREAAILAKMFASVYLNMSWIHIISPVGVRAGLKEWLRMVPSNKIIAFGDDLQYVETVFGHVQMARKNVAIVLAEMIEEGFISDSVALDVAQAIFHDNPARLYNLAASGE